MRIHETHNEKTKSGVWRQWCESEIVYLDSVDPDPTI